MKVTIDFDLDEIIPVLGKIIVDELIINSDHFINNKDKYQVVDDDVNQNFNFILETPNAKELPVNVDLDLIAKAEILFGVKLVNNFKSDNIIKYRLQFGKKIDDIYATIIVSKISWDLLVDINTLDKILYKNLVMIALPNKFELIKNNKIDFKTTSELVC